MSILSHQMLGAQVGSAGAPGSLYLQFISPQKWRREDPAPPRECP